MSSDFSVPSSVAGLGSGSGSGYGLQSGPTLSGATSGYGEKLVTKLKGDGQKNPFILVAIYVGAIFFTYNAGYIATLTFHRAGAGGLAIGSEFSGISSGTLKTCNDRIRQAQIGFFSSHACWYNISRRPDWVATRLFFQSRAIAMKKGLHEAGSDDKCGFISIGTGTYDVNPLLLNAYAADADAAAKIQLDDYVLNMKASSVFDQCYTFTYTPEQELPVAQQAMAGIKAALVRPLWSDADTSLDTEFAKITSTIVEGTIFLKSHLRSFESDLLAGFKTGLASGRVGGLIWEREVQASTHVRSLKDEVDFVSSFGYAVYLASAEEAEMSQQFQRVYTPSVYMRLDRGLWDGVFGLPNARIVFTLVAVQQTHPFRAYLDANQALCPIKMDKLGNPNCECMLENYAAAPDECSLASLVQRPNPSVKPHEAEWRQPLAQPKA